MSAITLKSRISNMTFVPDSFIDYYMINANGEYVKIYLYLLRCLGDASLADTLTTDKMADVFDCTEKDILRAFKYWENAGLMTLEFLNGTISSIHINECPHPSRKIPTAVSGAGQASAAKPDSDAAKSSPHNMSAAQMEKLANNQEVRELLGVAQAYMGKTLNHTETEILLFFYDQLGFSTDLIDYLLEYCASNNHKAFRYLEKVGLAWHEAGITSRSQAKEYVSSFSNTYFSVLKAFGISGRTPAKPERDFIDKWVKVYGFSLDIILEACSRTIASIHQPSFKYADSILNKWKKQGVSSLKDLKPLDDAHEKRSAAHAQAAATQQPPVKKNAFNNFPQRDYDFDELEKQLLNKL